MPIASPRRWCWDSSSLIFLMGVYVCILLLFDEADDVDYGAGDIEGGDVGYSRSATFDVEECVLFVPRGELDESGGSGGDVGSDFALGFVEGASGGVFVDEADFDGCDVAVEAVADKEAFFARV